MSLQYPRLIRIARPNAEAQKGQVAYQGVFQTEETTLIEKVPATIQVSSSGRILTNAGLPGDAPGPIKYLIFVQATVAMSAIILQERDLVYDDLVSPANPFGRRFQVDAWSPLLTGMYRIDCARLMV